MSWSQPTAYDTISCSASHLPSNCCCWWLQTTMLNGSTFTTRPLRAFLFSRTLCSLFLLSSFFASHNSQSSFAQLKSPNIGGILPRLMHSNSESAQMTRGMFRSVSTTVLQPRLVCAFSISRCSLGGCVSKVVNTITFAAPSR